jgi:predicted nucleotidyltransferase
VTARRTDLTTVCSALNEAGARYVLAGGRALQLWGSSRATRDIDLLIEPMLENGARVVAALAQVGIATGGAWLANELISRQVTTIGDNPKVDVFTVAWTVHFRDAHAAAMRFTLEGVEIPTMSIEHLIASKRTGRMQDAVDIDMLEEIRRVRGRSR